MELTMSEQPNLGDSTVGHAYLSGGEAGMLCVCSGDEPDIEGTLLSVLETVEG
jgi:hypothetical protein